MILLDIDDTLIDHSKAEYLASIQFGEYFHKFIPEYDEKYFASRWKSEAEKYYKKFLLGEVSFKEQRQLRIKGIFKNENMSITDIDEYFKYYKKKYEDNWELFDDVKPFLEKNREEGFGIISDGQHEQQTYKLKKMGILKYINFIVTAESSKSSKPNKKIFEQAIKLSKCKKDELCYIGDSLEKDAIGAKNAGIEGILLNRNGLIKANNVIVIQSLSDYSRKNA